MNDSVLTMFGRVVAQYGDKTAVRGLRNGQECSLSFKELNAQANQLAHLLISEGVTRGHIVPLLLERSPDYLVALLAVMKAGAAYLPLSPGMPLQRLRAIVEFVGARQILCSAPDEVELAGVSAIDLASLAGQIDYLPMLAPPVAPCGDDLAYLIYTSGSTGVPKGVPISHRALAVRMEDLIARYGYNADDQCTFNAGVAFDASVYEVFAALLAGATLHVCPEDIKLSPSAYCAFMAERAISRSWLPTPLMELLFLHWAAAPVALPALRLMTVGGERLKRRPPVSFPCPVENVYGPSEATIIACSGRVEPEGSDDRLPHIGTAVATCRLYLLDEAMQPVAPGDEGQLFIGGEGLSAGYYGQPELSARHFLPDPFAGDPAARMYATGDRCRIDAAGNVEFIGRFDDQVKLRGYRIELGEIEGALLAHPAVGRAVATTVRPGPDASEEIAVYVVAAEGSAPGTAELKAHLAASLPPYMLPTHLMLLDAFPMTANGKVDRKALPMPTAGVGPEVDLADLDEQLGELLQIYRAVLGRADIGPDSDFFAAGGNSIAAILLNEQILQKFDSKVPLKHFFEQSSPAAVLAYLERNAGGRKQEAMPVAVGERVPLSSHQRAIWLEMQRQGDSKAYHFKALVRFKGELDVAALESSLSTLYASHEVYRASVEVDGGKPYQRLREPWQVRLDVVDLRHLEQGEAEAQCVALLDGPLNDHFNIACAPLARMCLVRISEDHHALLVVEHHLIHDGWSFNLFLDQLFEGYEICRAALPWAPAAGRPYGEYSLAQQKWLDSEAAQVQRDYWRARLAGAESELRLPHRGPRRNEARRDGARRLRLDRALWQRCESFCRRHNLTAYMYTAAVLKLVLARYATQREISLGAPFANRGWPGFQRTLGMFVNPVVLRDDVDQALPWIDFLARVRDTVLEAHDHQELPFDEVVRELRPRQSGELNAFYQVMLGFHDSPFPAIDIPGLRIDVTEGYTSGACKLDMTLVFLPRLGNEGQGDPVHIVWEYRTDLFDDAFIDRFTDSFLRVFEAGLDHGSQAMASMPVLLEPALPQLGNPAPNRAPAGMACLHQLIAQQARATPHALAVDDGRTVLSYAELERRSDALAHLIVQHAPGERVGVFMDACAGAIVAILAILKTGRAYVPIDTALPDARISFIVEDASIDLVLCEPARATRLAGTGVQVLDPEQATAHHATGFVSVTPGPDSPAYVIYTSGSTGVPKGVVVAHRGVVNLVQDMQRLAPVAAGARATLLARLCFDVSAYEIFAALTCGACLMPVPEALRADENAYFAWLAEHGVGAAWVPPFFVKGMLEWVERHPGRLALVRTLVGVEPLLESRLVALQRLVSGMQIVNGYGPTETTICSALYAVPSELPACRDGAAPIGHALSHSELFVVDAYGNPCVAGAVGELLVGGVGVALGYLNRPELNRAAFIANPFGEGVVYRTGDLVRADASGLLHFVGRADSQVKVRGHRIELAEVEAALQRHPEVAQACVAVQRQAEGSAFLAAYIAGAATPDAATLRTFLAAQLPDYMVPSCFVGLAQMPMTPSGKVDRSALPAAAVSEEQFIAPANATEDELVRIYAGLLGLERVSTHHSFFEQGGHSLLAMKLISQLFTAFGVYMELRDIMDAPTPAALATLVLAKQAAKGAAPVGEEDEDVFTF